MKRRAAARYTRTLVTERKISKQRLFSPSFFKFGQIWRADFWSQMGESHNPARSSFDGESPVQSSLSSPHHHRHHARSVPRNGPLRACLMLACSSACVWPAPALLVCGRPTPCLRVPLLCVGSRHACPSGARQPHDHVRDSPTPNAAGALLILHSSLLARP